MGRHLPDRTGGVGRSELRAALRAIAAERGLYPDDDTLDRALDRYAEIVGALGALRADWLERPAPGQSQSR